MSLWLFWLLFAAAWVIGLIGWALVAINAEPERGNGDESWSDFSQRVQDLLREPANDQPFDPHTDARDYLQRARDSGAV